MTADDHRRPAKRPGVAKSERACPICGKPRSDRYDPFCSKRCADVAPRAGNRPSRPRAEWSLSETLRP